MHQTIQSQFQFQVYLFIIKNILIIQKIPALIYTYNIFSKIKFNFIMLFTDLCYFIVVISRHITLYRFHLDDLWHVLIKILWCRPFELQNKRIIIFWIKYWSNYKWLFHTFLFIFIKIIARIALNELLQFYCVG